MGFTIAVAREGVGGTMSRRELFEEHDVPCPDLVLRAPANWTAILFLAGLGGLHLGMASHAFLHQRWEGFLSLIFGVVFMAAAIACAVIRSDVAVFREAARICLRTGIRRFRYERAIPFDRVRSIRLTLMNQRNVSDSRIEVVCEGEVIECPPTAVPRQEALCLALLMNVRLVKVYGYDCPDVSERLDKLTSA
jgi:hypothetical protein